MMDDYKWLEEGRRRVEGWGKDLLDKGLLPSEDGGRNGANGRGRGRGRQDGGARSAGRAKGLGRGRGKRPGPYDRPPPPSDLSKQSTEPKEHDLDDGPSDQTRVEQSLNNTNDSLKTSMEEVEPETPAYSSAQAEPKDVLPPESTLSTNAPLKATMIASPSPDSSAYWKLPIKQPASALSNPQNSIPTNHLNGRGLNLGYASASEGE